MCVPIYVHTFEFQVCVCVRPCTWGFLSVQAPAVAKVQVAWLTKDTLEVALTPSTRVAHVLGQFTGRLSPGSQGPEGNEDKDGLLPR